MPNRRIDNPVPTGRAGRGSALQLAFLLLLLGALGVLAGCGGGSIGTTDGATRTYTDVAGNKLTIPVRPQRVVALSEPSLDDSVALGVTPIATTAGRGQGTISAYLQGKVEGIGTVGILGQPNIEKIAALAPDLILTDGTAILDGSIVEKLQAIAPVVDVSKTGENWKTAFLATADILGRQARGKALMAEYDARVKSVKSRLGANADAEVSIVRWGGIGLPAVLMRELAASRVLSDLGLGEGGPGGGVSEKPADVASAEEAMRIAEDETPGFKRLRAYRLGHIVPVDGSAWTSAGGYLAEQVVLDDVERALDEGS
ncbi:MAG: ABC transporter substrate-binding protein [Actinobacteria bacterium]|nr:ABC transporter substrate-binding protein [Actinomycetota bacterium]